MLIESYFPGWASLLPFPTPTLPFHTPTCPRMAERFAIFHTPTAPSYPVPTPTVFETGYDKKPPFYRHFLRSYPNYPDFSYKKRIERKEGITNV
jgi:hypothetical protein